MSTTTILKEISRSNVRLKEISRSNQRSAFSAVLNIFVLYRNSRSILKQINPFSNSSAEPVYCATG